MGFATENTIRLESHDRFRWCRGVHQVLVSPQDSAQADFQFDPKKFRFSEREILLQCKGNVKEFPNACGGDFTVEAWQYDYLWNRNFMYMAL